MESELEDIKVPEGFVQTEPDGTKYFYYKWDGKTYVPTDKRHADMVKIDYPGGRHVWGNPVAEEEKKSKKNQG